MSLVTLQYEITREIYEQEKYPKFGKTNPEKMDFEFWKYIIKTKDWAFRARASLGKIKDLCKFPAVWSFARSGMTCTELLDGRKIYIGGEDGDFYEPDFYIYNEVIVIDTNGEIIIYGYPKDIFSPIDSHSATLVENGIYIIGCLGYLMERIPKETPVYYLNCQTFEIHRIETKGKNPGWLFQHEA